MSASPRSSLEESLDAVRSCDVYVGVLGHNYGSAPRSRPGVSFTEAEYDYAVELGKPRLIFLLDPDAPIPRSLIDFAQIAKQDAFRAKVGVGTDDDQGIVRKTFSSPEELRRLIGEALDHLRTITTEPPGPAGGGGPSAPAYLPSLRADVMDRPDVMRRLLEKLDPARANGPTAVTGGEGMGKTTLVRQACDHARVREWFPGGVRWLTMPIPGSVPTAVLLGASPQLGDPNVLGTFLRNELAGQPATLVVADGVSSSEQIRTLRELEPPHRLVFTTDIAELVSGNAEVAIGEMSRAEALTMYASVEGVDPETIERLVTAVGGRPNRLLAVKALLVHPRHGTAQSVAEGLLASSAGPGAVLLDTIIDGALRTLEPAHTHVTERFFELAVFPPDIDIPLDAVALLWAHTARYTRDRTVALCGALADRFLIVDFLPDGPNATGTLRLPDEFSRRAAERLGPEELAARHEELLTAARARVTGAVTDHRVPWWTLSRHPEDEYFWRYLVHHLIEAGRTQEAEELCVDLQWVEAQLQHLGVRAVEVDLARVTSDRAREIRVVVAQSERLLAPTEPPEAVVDIFWSRLSTVPGLREEIARRLTEGRGRAHLTNWWQPPDMPNQALRREFQATDRALYAAASVANWDQVVTCGSDRMLRIFDVLTGSELALYHHTDWIRACAVAPGGSWIATACDDGTLRVFSWDRKRLKLHKTFNTARGNRVGAPFRSCVIDPNGTWVAAGDESGVIHRWGLLSGVSLPGFEARDAGAVHCCTVTPDGRRLVAGYDDGALRVWNLTGVTGPRVLAPADRERSRRSPVYCCAVGGTWAVAGYQDGRLRRWDLDSGAMRVLPISSDAEIHCCAVHPGEEWVVAAGRGRELMMCRAADGDRTWVIQGPHENSVHACAVAVQGDWLATVSSTGVTRVWNIGTMTRTTVPDAAPGSARTVEFAADDSWLASTGDEREIRIRNAISRKIVGTLDLPGGADRPRATAIAPSGTWVASLSGDGQVRIWDRSSGRLRHTLDLGRTTAEGPDTEAAPAARLMTALAIHPAEDVLVTVGRDGAESVVAKWHPGDTNLPDKVIRTAGALNRCVYLPDGSQVVLADTGGRLSRWDTAADTAGRITSVALITGRIGVAPDGSWIAVGQPDGQVVIVGLDGDVRTRWLAHDGTVTGCAVSPDGRWLGTVGHDGALRIWQTSRSDQPWACATMLRADGRLFDVVWAHRRQSVCAAGEKGVYLFRLNPPRP